MEDFLLRRWRTFAWRAAGGALAILAMHFLAGASHMPLALVPFATSIVLVLGSPNAEPAQPRAIVGGHLLSSLVGLAVSLLAGSSPWAAALAVGLAMVLMFSTRTMHPPAGIDPLIIVNDSLPWTFLFIPVLAGTVLLVCFAFIWHNAPVFRSHRRRWPEQWW
jgi:CBS-domain-containing membrane protein